MVRIDHPPAMSEVKFRSSCDSCLSTKVKCSQTRPACARCTQHGRQCVYSQYRKIGRPSAKALGALTEPRGQLQERAAKPGRKPKKTQQQHSPQLPVEHSPRGTEPLLPPNVLGEPLGSSVNPSHVLNDFGTPAPGSRASSILEELHAGNNSASSAGDSALSLDQNMSDSGIGASLASSLEYGIGEVDWATLQGIIEGSAFQELDLAPQGQYYGSTEPRIWGSGLSPVCLDDPGPTAQVEPLFSPLTSNYSLFAGHPTVHSPRRPTLASRPSASLIGESNPSLLSTRCTSHCYGALTSQLTKLSDLQALGTSVALDVLLNLENQVSRARDKILRCQSCLAATGCGQTLVLLTLVVANVLSLFENSSGGSQEDGQSEGDRGCIPSAESPMSRGSSLTDASDWRSALPHTKRPLVLGTVQLNESVKRAFSRHLVRMYLDRQRGVVKQLEQLLRQTDGNNTSSKLTEDLLQDVLGRVERFIGFMTLTASLERQVWD
ncbi:hypothetical protein IFM58399_00405 [Aspergillus lentulus]|uniref:Zn(II)2Cys6 transcription factor domain-containing protein n=1 Tax=Aspergillus lentulus TaxID=293939 RepID=UPI0013933565|nr:uncharacterized protein IFM58399_00405 [Aspergillus lentulus]GFF23712.1 hypothetical protein IFM58399_00405 [Aspergillus lentulus]